MTWCLSLGLGCLARTAPCLCELHTPSPLPPPHPGCVRFVCMPLFVCVHVLCRVPTARAEGSGVWLCVARCAGVHPQQDGAYVLEERLRLVDGSRVIIGASELGHVVRPAAGVSKIRGHTSALESKWTQAQVSASSTAPPGTGCCAATPTLK